MQLQKVNLTPPLPTLQQVLWRANCPPNQAGPRILKEVTRALEHIESLAQGSWCGAVLFQVGEKPDFLETVFPDLAISVMATTLGLTMQTYLDTARDLDRFIMDSAASVMVESYMKRLQLELACELKMTPTKRVAPGYGSHPLSWQKEIITMFPQSGIACTEAFMLIPEKSMTGVVGWVSQKN